MAHRVVAEVAQCPLDDRPVAAVLDRGHKGVCAKLTVHTRKIPSECTGLILNGKDMLCTDWRNLEALCVDVFAGQPGLLQVEAGSFGKALARVNIRLVQGRNHCRIPGRALRSILAKAW